MSNIEIKTKKIHNGTKHLNPFADYLFTPLSCKCGENEERCWVGYLAQSFVSYFTIQYFY